MAEATAALSLTAAILPVIEYVTRLVARLKEFPDTLDDKARDFLDITRDLMILLNGLDRTRQKAQSGLVDHPIQEALLLVIQGCHVQINALSTAIAKLIPKNADSSFRGSAEPLQGGGFERNIKHIKSTLRGHIQSLTYHESIGYKSPPIPPEGPIFDVPFDRNPRFIGRVDVLSDVEIAIVRGSNIALSGISGIGKSQIAIEAAYRYRQLWPDGHVFWIQASTRERFHQAYQDIARRLLSHLSIHTKIYQTLQAVCDWFDENGPWLIILDDLGDAEIFLSYETSKPLCDYIPKKSTGSVIITSRDRLVGERLVGQENCTTVAAPPKQETEDLLRSKVAPDEWSSSAGGALIEALEHLPLAITQAAAYINENSLTIEEYKEALKAVDDEIVKPPSNDCGEIRSFENGHSAIKTWKISLNQISRQKPKAVELMSLMAAFGRGSIPSTLLHQEGERNTSFMTAISTLRAFSLISTVKSRYETYEMHHLVQLAIQNWLKTQGTWSKWQEEALRRIEDQFPYSDSQLWPQCDAIYPHARFVSEYKFEDPTLRLVQASLLFSMSGHQMANWSLELVLAHADSAVKCRQELLGPKHPLTLISRSVFAETLQMKGSPGALKIIEDLLAEFEETPEPYSATYLGIKRILATSTEDGEKSEKLLREILKDWEKIGETEDMDYLIAIDDLGVTLLRLGRKDESVAWHQKAMDRKTNLLGADHPSTLRSLMNLNISMKDSDDNEEMDRKLLAKQEKILGPNHPDTLLNRMSLSRALQLQKRHIESQELALQALAGYQKVLGLENPQTLAAMEAVAVGFTRMETYEPARIYFEKALGMLDKVLGHKDGRTRSCWWAYLSIPVKWRTLVQGKIYPADHPVSIAAMRDRALSLYIDGHYRESEELYRRVVADFEEHGDEEMLPDAMHDLGETLRELWKREEAEDLYRRALTLKQRTLKPDDASVMSTLNSLGIVLQDQDDDKMDEAAALFRQLLEIHNRSPILSLAEINVRNNLAMIQIARGRYTEAEAGYQRLLSDREEIQGAEHPDTLLCMLSLAMAVGYQGRVQEAAELNQRALQGLLINPGPFHPNTLVCQSNLAKYLMISGKVEEAEATIRTVIEKRTEILGAHHGNTLKSMGRLSEILEVQGRMEEALIVQEEVCHIASWSLGQHHPETQAHVEDLNLLKEKIGKCRF